MSSHSYSHHHLSNLALRITLTISMILAMFATIPAQVARASIWTVCASGCNYTTIVAAHASASVLDGDTIFLDEDVHTENDIVIAKRITLEGRGRDLTILQSAASPNFANTYLLNTYGGKPVTIRNMTLRNGGPSSWTGQDGAIGVVTPTTLDNLLITQNYYQKNGATAKGGAIYATAALTVTNCIISDNKVKSDLSAAGAGIYASNDAKVKIFNSTIANNQAIGNPIANGSGTTPLAIGGGIYVLSNITIMNSTISGNTATGGSVTTGTGGPAWGGGIATSLSANPTITITNSTISGNTATGGDGPTDGSAQAGGLSIVNGVLNFTTVVSNTVSGNQSKGGGVYFISDWGTNPDLKNSIFANNSGPSNGNGPDLYGTFDSLDYNLILNANGYTLNGTTTHNKPGVDPNLAPLADNSGETKTHAPRASSPVINAIPSGTNGCTPGSTTDQTGKKRPSNGACEMGSYEMPWLLYLPVVLR